jgi:hypothetical protein
MLFFRPLQRFLLNVIFKFDGVFPDALACYEAITHLAPLELNPKFLDFVDLL